MMANDDSGHYTHEGTGFVDATLPNAVEEARKRHHLATADPEPERGDGTLTGPAHEEKYGLERADHSAELWRAVGVHPIENRALRPGEEGYDDSQIEAAVDDSKSEKATAPRASDTK